MVTMTVDSRRTTARKILSGAALPVSGSKDHVGNSIIGPIHGAQEMVEVPSAPGRPLGRPPALSVEIMAVSLAVSSSRQDCSTD